MGQVISKIDEEIIFNLKRFPKYETGTGINIDVRLPFLTDLLCDTICQVVAGPDNSPGIGQPLSGL